MNKLNKLFKNRYLIFLITIIILLALMLLLVQNSISLQKSDAHIINVSGKQRMLSQRITKLNNIIKTTNNINSKIDVNKLKLLIKEWEEATNYLILKNEKDGNKTIDSLFKEIKPYQNKILEYSKSIINTIESDKSVKDLKDLEALDLAFLTTMDTIVNEYQKNAERKLQKLENILYLLAFIVVLILIFQFIYIIKPVYKLYFQKNLDLQKTNRALVRSQEKVRNNLKELKQLKNKIEKGAELGKIFIEQAPNAIAMFDKDMKYIAASHRWKEDYKLTGQEIIGRSHYEIFPEIGDDWKEHHKACLKGAINKCDEAPFKRADGTTQWLTWDVRPWYISKGKIGGLLMYTADITTIKEKDQERLRIEKILDKTNQIARIGTWEVNLIENKVNWSKVTREIHDVPDDFIPNLNTAIEFYKEGESRIKIKKAINTAIEKGKPFDIELELVTAKGNVVWTRAIGQAEFENGKCILLNGVFQDINKVKLAKATLNSVNEELNAILNSGPISIIGTDKNGLITHFNKGAESMLHYSSNEMVGLKTPEIIHLKEETLKRGEALSKKYNKEIIGFDVLVANAKQGESESRECTYVRKDGTTFPVLSVTTAIKNNKDEITGFIKMATDISESVKNQKIIIDAKNNLEILTRKLTSQNNQLASFAHITSHNLRAPVSNLNSLLQIYKMAESDEERSMLFEKFEKVIDHLTSTLNTLVDAIRIRDDSSKNIEKILFKDILNKTMEILTGQIIETETNITSNFTNAPSISYNKTYLESIFLNLITNSIKYRSIERAPKITIETTNLNGRIQLSITDNGLGIDLNKHGHKLFGLNKTFHRHAEAKGVGLYLTKIQIESMGGTISASSKVNEGTTFTITF
ncbi:PAS domain S-box protein [Lutibacter sp. A64]|uniref:PAS domain S-box protein n=1 Tax=Lutibacter sp. A64 TaxID=2918526 RepID=UPI001F06ADB3|nr:PAS domain S-box protein [Lutibacter sp. A64]UMB53101.1 PAS domain S-box protein [Lutibacter sp. A64]